MKRIIQAASLALVAVAFMVAATSAEAQTTHPEDYQINYSVMECIDYHSEYAPIGSYQLYGYENQRSAASTIFCPLSFIRKFAVDGDETEYRPGANQSQGYGFTVDMTVLDTQTISQISCHLYGHTGTVANNYFDYQTTEDQHTGPDDSWTGLKLLEWEDIWDDFTTDVEYMFIRCVVGGARTLPGNQVIGYRLYYYYE